MITRHAVSLHLSFFLALALATGCIEPPEDLAADESAVIAGTPIIPYLIDYHGLVDVGNGCSGVVFTNDWVLTAGHCVGTHRQKTTVVKFGAQVQTSSRLYRFGGVDDAMGPDLALIHPQNPLVLYGEDTGFERPVMPAYQGIELTLYGRGENAVGGGGFNTWRAGKLGYSYATGDEIHTLAGPGGQAGWRGDSGAPSFAYTVALIGIQSRPTYTCAPTSPPGECIPATVTGGVQVHLAPILDGVRAVMSRAWDASRSTDMFDVTSAELRVARKPENDLNLAPWGLERAIATELCENRGFLAGHWNGHQAGGLYGLVCSGPGATWFDATPSDIAETGWSVTDLEVDDWAQAARAATGLCELRGHVAGFFDGHQSVGSKYGTVCLDGANVAVFDATTAELAATTWPVVDLTIGWAHAQRAAHGWCEMRGWTTGFLNGHHSGDLFGVVCQR